jgi:hypothetical protein
MQPVLFFSTKPAPPWIHGGVVFFHVGHGCSDSLRPGDTAWLPPGSDEGSMLPVRTVRMGCIGFEIVGFGEVRRCSRLPA